MFAALMLVRLREAVYEQEGLVEKTAWVSEDEVAATDLPLARAAEKALASMHGVLTNTKEKRDEEVERYHKRVGGLGQEEDKKRIHLMQSKAAEVRLVRNLDSLKNPVVRFKAETI